MDAPETLKQLADEHWAQRNEPLFLSAIPKLVAARAPNAVGEIKAEGLKSFIQRTAGDWGYRLVEHPTQRAKLAIVPADVSYEFDSAPPRPSQSSLSVQDVRSLARLLDALTPEERASISFPGTVVAKLLNPK